MTKMPRHIRKFPRPLLLLVVGAFVAVGASLIIRSHAATPYISTEPETGTVKQAALVTDATASGGKAVQFKAAPANYNQIAVVGDSLTVMNSNGLTWVTNLLIANGWAAANIRVNAVSGRSIDGSEAGTVTPTTIQGIDSLRASGFDPRVWLVELGTNNYTQDPTTQWTPKIQNVINKILSGPAGNYKIYWMGTGFRDANDVHNSLAFQSKLLQFQNSRTDFTACDYNAYLLPKRSDPNWNSYWIADGIHNTTAAFQTLRLPYYATCIAPEKP